MERSYQFEIDLVTELEESASKPLRAEPLDTWNPRKPAPPERHVQLGLLAGRTIIQIRNLLETQNSAFNDIESLLGIQYYMKEYTLHPVAEQVWIWGSNTLTKYLYFLTMPGAIRSDFYRIKHDKLLDVLKKACAEKPDERPTFHQLLRSWLNSTTTPSDDASETVSVSDDLSTTAPPAAQTVFLQSPSSTRLVLNVSYGSEGRKKTRKSPRN